MKTESLIALGILFCVLCGCLSHGLLESFRGRGGRGGRRGGGGGFGRRGGGGFGRRGGFRRGGRGWGGGSGGYLRRFRRRRHHGGWWRQPNLWGSWNNWPRWSQFWSLPCNCKRGCTPDGCAVPGTGPDDCVWASDCNCCGNVYY